MTQYPKIYNYINGEFIKASQSVIPISDMGFLRGYGVFDYMQSYQGKLFHAEDHIDRLIKSALKVDIEIPYSKDEILQVLEKIIDLNPKISAGVRVVVTAGNVSADLISPDHKPNVCVIFHPLKKIDDRFYTQGLKAALTTDLRFFPEVKSTNYMQAILAITKAKKRGYDDILYLDYNEDILEASTSNIFFLKNGVWITDDSSRILKGITRKIILEIMAEGYNVEFQALKKHQLQDCQEAFLCSSAKEIMPLVEVDGIKIGDGKPGIQTTKLSRLFKEYVKSKIRNPDLATL